MRKLISTIYVVIASLSYQSVAADVICSSDALLTCLHLTKQQCSVAHEKSFELCESFHNLDDRYPAEGTDVVLQVSNCSIKQFFIITSVSTDDLKKCEKEFVNAVNKQTDRIKKEIGNYH